MKPIGIITDSHSSISQLEAEKLGIRVLPMPFYIDGECYYEGINLTREEFFSKLESGSKITTSQPGPADVYDIWDKALEEYEKVLYMPLSSGLSGSYATAVAMAQEEPYEGRIIVVDHGQIAAPLYRMILDTLDMIEKGYSAEKIKEILESGKNRMMIYIGVQTLEYLKRGGRVTPAAAAIGSVLNIKPVLKLETGKLDSFKKCRGFGKAKKAMIEAMQEEINVRFADAKADGQIHLLAATSANEEETAEWVREIEEAFPGMKVFCAPLSLGVSCHTGTGALGIGCAVVPDYKVEM
ncbi:MAG: DegV family protein [Lachnospiraceae bacterium]|nr:DegV family protein [Lachnospiraceae bacterium]MBQ6855473.1 DegV family protein [Lachnospiraceae bacterium]